MCTSALFSLNQNVVIFFVYPPHNAFVRILEDWECVQGSGIAGLIRLECVELPTGATVNPALAKL